MRVLQWALSSACVMGMAVVGATPVFAQGLAAQTTDTPDSGIQDIIVTAQRRTENVQRTALDIDVVTASAIANNGVTQTRDLAALITGLQISPAGSSTQIFIRGIGDTSVTSQSNPGVAFHVDGVYVARPTAVEGNFFDVQRVEVLKGPQGTLYGRNATGGAINVITNKPKLGVREMTGAIEVGNYEKMSLDAAVNLPLGDTFAIRVATQIVHRSPYVTYNFADDIHQSARLQALWQPDDRLTVRLSGDYIHVGGGGGENVAIPGIPGLSPWTSATDPRVVAVFNQRAAAAGLCAPPFPGSPGLLSTYVGACPAVPLPIGPDGALVPVQFRQLVTPPAEARGQTNNKFWSVSGQLDYDFGPVVLTVLPAYRYASTDYATYPSLFIFDVSADGIPETSKATSVEVRLGNDSSRFKWVLGGFYFHEKQFGINFIDAGVLQRIVIPQIYDTRSLAGFGQATFSITDTFRLTGGARYTSDRKIAGRDGFETVFLDGSTIFAAAVAAGCVPGPAYGTTLIGCQGASIPVGRKTFAKFNWRAGLEFDVGPQNMLFAAASTGFKSGGFYSGILADGSRGFYGPETLQSFEVGSRNRFLDNRLQVNLDAFYYKYNDHQEPVIIRDATGAVVQATVNAGQGRAYGASADILFKMTDNDTLRVSGEYMESKYTDFARQSPIIPGQPLFVPPGSTGCLVANSATTQTVDCSGFPLARAPKLSGLTSYSHVFDLSNNGSIEAEGSVHFSGKRYLSTDYLSLSLAPAFQIYNASVTYRHPSRKWSLSGFVRNITNEAVYTISQRNPFGVDFSTATIAPPRTYGARLSFTF